MSHSVSGCNREPIELQSRGAVRTDFRPILVVIRSVLASTSSARCFDVALEQTALRGLEIVERNLAVEEQPIDAQLLGGQDKGRGTCRHGSCGELAQEGTPRPGGS